MALEQAVDDGYLVASPARRVKGPKLPKPSLPALTEMEVHPTLAAARAHYGMQHARMLLGLGTGMDQGEALALDWSDLDLTGKVPTATISKTHSQMSWAHGRSCEQPALHTPTMCPSRVKVAETGDAKTEAANRVVPLPPPAVDAVKAVGTTRRPSSR